MKGRVWLGVSVYGLMSALGLFWAVFRGRPNLTEHPDPWFTLEPTWAVGASLLAGAVLALVTVRATRVLVGRAGWATRLHLELRALLGPLPASAIALLALSSGIGEEVFFRGAIQPSLGFWLTSIAFGLLHIGPWKQGWVWTLWATAMGFALGAIHEATGSLAGPILAHVWINYENLVFIVTHDPRARHGESRGPSPPKLVGKSERR